MEYSNTTSKKGEKWKVLHTILILYFIYGASQSETPLNILNINLVFFSPINFTLNYFLVNFLFI